MAGGSPRPHGAWGARARGGELDGPAVQQQAGVQLVPRRRDGAHEEGGRGHTTRRVGPGAESQRGPFPGVPRSAEEGAISLRGSSA